MKPPDYKELFEQFSASVVVMDKEFTIVAASDSYLKATGTMREDIVGRDIFHASAYISNYIAANGESKIRASFDRVLNDKIADTPAVIEYNILQHEPEGGGFDLKYWRPYHSPVLDEFNNVKYIIQRMEEVTEKKILTARREAEKKALKSIQESNKRYYMMLMQSPFAISVMKGKDMVVTLANDLMKEFWGKGMFVEGKTLLQLLPELIDQPFPELIAKVYTTGTPHYAYEILAKLEHKGETKDRYFNIVYQPYYEADQTISGVTTIAYEVTGQVLARQKIEESATFNRTVLESSTDCVKIIDDEGRLLFMNINGLCALDIPDFATIKNKHWWDMWNNENQHMVKAAISKALNGEMAHFQALDITLKGSLKWWDVIVSPVLNEGNGKKISRLISVSRDITEQKQAILKLKESEHRFQEMVYSSPYMICILKGKDIIIEIANDAILSTWGKGKEVIGKPMLEVLPEIIEQGFTEIFHNVFTTGITYQAHEMPVHVQRHGKMELSYYTFVYQAQRNMNNEIEGIAIIAREVTPQALFNKQIKTSEERYHKLISTSPLAIGFLQGEELVITTANEAIVKIWGKGKDVIGKPYFDLLPELAEQGYREVFHNVYTTGTPFNASETAVKILRNDKMEVQYYNFLLHAQRNINGEIDGIGIIASEVTSQALLNKKIKTSEERFRLLVQQAPVAICVLRGEDYIIEMINNGMVEMWDRKMEEVINKPAFEVLPEFRDQGLKELLDTVYKTGERFVAQELPLNIRRYGALEKIFVKFVYEPLREANGNISGVMALAHEITEQVNARKRIEESEKKYRVLTNAMPQKITNADTEGNATFFNQQWLDDTGLTFEELKGWGWEKAMHPDDLQRTVESWQHSVLTGDTFDLECRILNVKGEYKWNLSRALPVRDENGKIIMWVGSNTDIHEQKEQKAVLEKAVKERTKQLEEANNELVFQNQEKEKRSAELNLINKELVFQNKENKKRSAELIIANKEMEAFTYVSSHDLQEPLRKIQTFATVILEKENNNLSENGKYILERMQAAAERMQQLIEDLLDYSRLNTADRKFEHTDLSNIVEEVKAEFKEFMGEKHATIDSAELCHANIIPFQFRQLMHNLISNALKFSNPQIPLHITIKSSIEKGNKLNNGTLLPDKTYCHITFKDNGIGFEPHFSKRIFEVFQKLHSKEEYAGTGIGLAIVKKIVDNHNGIIIATSELNKGTIFDIHIPAN